jgi:hypothetical protein
VQKGNTPLLLAVRSKHIDIVSYLLEQAGANINATDDNGCSCLHVAALLGDIDIVTLLLKSGADPTKTDKFGKKPFDVAQRDFIQLKDLLRKAAARNVNTTPTKSAPATTVSPAQTMQAQPLKDDARPASKNGEVNSASPATAVRTTGAAKSDEYNFPIVTDATVDTTASAVDDAGINKIGSSYSLVSENTENLSRASSYGTLISDAQTPPEELDDAPVPAPMPAAPPLARSESMKIPIVVGFVPETSRSVPYQGGAAGAEAANRSAALSSKASAGAVPPRPAFTRSASVDSKHGSSGSYSN